MLSEIQFKGLYSGRLSYVEEPNLIGMQLFGIVCLRFNTELFAEQRVKLMSMIEKAKQEGSSFAIILEFPQDIEFSSVDMNMLKDIYILSLEWGIQLIVVCGNNAKGKLKAFSRTQNIGCYTELSEALLHVKKEFQVGFEHKITRNLIVMESDAQQRLTLTQALLKDRFSAHQVDGFDEAEAMINNFGKIIDGAIIEFIYPEFREIELIALIKKLNPQAKILIHTAVLDPKILQVCQEYQIKSVIKSPYKPPNLIKKFKNDFPERDENYLGFKD